MKDHRLTKGPPGGTATAPEDLSPERRAYLAALRRDRRRLVLCRAGVLVGFVLLWELAARVGWIDSFIMSSPSRILATFGELRENQILTHMAVTLYETLTGFCLGAFGGLGLAVLLWQSDFVSRVAEPYLVVLNSLPKIALGPVIIIWVGAGTEAIIVMAVAISMIVTVLEMLEGFHTTDPELLRMAGAFGAGRWPAVHQDRLSGQPAGAVQLPQDQHRPLPGRRHRRGVSGLQGRAGLPDRLWRPGVPAGSGDGRGRDPGADGSGAVRLHHAGRTRRPPPERPLNPPVFMKGAMAR